MPRKKVQKVEVDEYGRIALALTEEGVPTHSILTKQRLESIGRPYRGTVSNIWHDNTIQNILKNT